MRRNEDSIMKNDCFNLNLLECKLMGGANDKSTIDVLISTYWNVNENPACSA